MRYKIKEFEFDSVSLVLSKNGEDLAIRHNEAKVLALLLEQADKVLSKEEILSHVWQDKVVSEQAVFQNISHLRNLFGSQAIKTFSKRGYQWQLQTETIELVMQPSENDVQLTNQPAKQQALTIKPKKQFSWLVVAAVTIIFVVIGVVNLQSDDSDTNALVANIGYIPFDTLDVKADIVLEDNQHFNFTKLTHTSSAKFKAALEVEYQALASSHPLVLTGEIRKFNQVFYLDFLLKGPFAQWKGQFWGSSKAELKKQLLQHLKQESIYDILTKAQSPQLKLANLSIAHQQSPEDFIVLGELINIYISMDELEKAMVMADKMFSNADSQSNYQQAGNALLYQSTILTRKELYELSSQKLILAREQFIKINDLKRQADTWNAQSWLDHQFDDYNAIKKDLLTSAQLAFDAKDIERELGALTYLSVMAHKHHQDEDKYRYLTKAESKMRAYQLPIYRFAKIPFHHAIHAKTLAAKEPHLIQALEYTALTPNHWVAQTSRRQLMEHYIAKDRLVEADALLANLSTDNAENSYLKTLLAKAKLDRGAFIEHAQRTFELANLSGNRGLSLDVALLLCEEPDKQINYDFYSQYIHENANKYWRRANESKLLALSL